MKTLGIDYGRAKVGIAIGVNGFVEPYKVIHYNEKDKLLKELKSIIEAEKVDKVVIGISEGEMAEESKNFAEALHSSLSDVPFELFDETLTSQDAQRLSREAGISRKKAHNMEDAYAAAIMLQNYLDSVK